MKTLINSLQLRFLPGSADVALLVLRVWAGLFVLLLHGWSKATNYGNLSSHFADPFGLGQGASLALVIFAEVVCAALVVLGLFTRFAALVCVISMSVAFYFAHGARLVGQGNGELPFAYAVVFLGLFLAGAGRFSLDAKIARAV